MRVSPCNDIHIIRNQHQRVMSEIPRTSVRRFERIAKKIVREDIEKQQQDEETRFFVDKDVFDLHLPEMKDKIEDSSLSDFFLKYDFSIHTTELVNYFGHQQSRKRDFVNLRYMSVKYGYHLCYMALRESTSETNENDALVRQMKSTAISLNKSPPSDLFIDSPLSSSSSSASNSPTNSGDEDIPRGQGERERNTDANQIENKLAELKVEHFQKPIPVTEVSEQPTSPVVPSSNSYAEETGGQVPEENKMDSPRHTSFTPLHLSSCKCQICRSLSDPGPSSTQKKFKRSQSEAVAFVHVPLIEESHSNADKSTSTESKEIPGERPQSFPLPHFTFSHEVTSTGHFTSSKVSGDNVDSEPPSGNTMSTSIEFYQRSKQSESAGGRSTIVSGLQNEEEEKEVVQIEEESGEQHSNGVLAQSNERTIDSGKPTSVSHTSSFATSMK